MKSHRLAEFGILLLAVVLYSASISHGFVYDDAWIVEQNPRVHTLDDPGEFFTGGYWVQAATEDQGDAPPALYRPVAVLSYALNHAVHGLAPAGYHLVNLLLHGLCTWLVLLLGKRLGYSNASALRAALIFAVLAIHTEAVVYVVGRADLLAAAGVLGMIVLYRDGRAGAALLAGLTLILALFSKESAVVGLGLCMWCDWVAPRDANLPLGRRVSVQRLMPAIAALAVFAMMRYSAVGMSLSQPYEQVNPLAFQPPVERIFKSCHLLLQYFVQTVFPSSLSAEYSPVGMGWMGWGTPGGIAIAVAVPVLLGGLVALQGSARSLVLGGGWFLLAFATTANVLFPIGTLAGDRLAYLPSVGVALLLAGPLRLAAKEQAAKERAANEQQAATEQEDQSEPGKAQLPSFLPKALLVLFVASQVAVGVWYTSRWKDSVQLFETAIANVPGSTRARYQLARALLERARISVTEGNTVAAIPDLERAATINPGDLEIQQRLGLLHLLEGDSAAGRSRLLEVIEKAGPTSPLGRETQRMLDQLKRGRR